MKLGFIGLGKMGKNMVLNLIDKGHSLVVYDKSFKSLECLKKKKKICIAYSIREFVKNLPERKIIWLMMPAGKQIDLVISKLIRYLNKGDVIIDGGNSYFEDSIKRYNNLKKKKIDFLDCGVSGGVYGARRGACMMIGGEKKIFEEMENMFKDMSAKDGYAYMGKSGAGHFVKMVHNGIEYGMMGSIAEGFEAVKNYSKKFGIDVKDVAKVYAHGSIIEGKLMSWLLAGIRSKDFKLIKGEVPYGETEDEMKKLKNLSKMPILHQSIIMRARTRKKASFKGKIISLLRNQFGGHAFKKK